jgi:hypothetical protein
MLWPGLEKLQAVEHDHLHKEYLFREPAEAARLSDFCIVASHAGHPPHAAPMDVVTKFDAHKQPVTERMPLDSGLGIDELFKYELRARKMLTGKAEGKKMKLSKCGY